MKRSDKNASSGEIGFAEHRAWTPCKTDEEARKSLDATTAKLRRVAQEKGFTLLDSEDPVTSQSNGFVLKYWSERNQGTLEGKYELSDANTDGKTVKAYFVRLKLTEVIREQ